MPNAENTPDIRELSDAELSNISGGMITWMYAAIAAGITAGWDNAPGVTAKDAATALGVEHLL